MLRKSLITTRQFILLLYVLFTAFTSLQSPGILIYQADRDAWICVIIAWVLDITFGIIYAVMGVRFKNESFVQYSETILGKFWGKIFGLVFPFSFYFMIPIFLCSLSSVIKKAFLPKTSNIIILTTGYLVTAYCARKGIKAIARACEVAGPIFIMSMFALFVFIAPWVKLDHIEPILDSGFIPVFRGSLFILSYLGICIMMGMLIPICNKPENGMKAKFLASTMGSATIVILIIVTIGTFGIQQAYNIFYPSLQVAKIIKIGEFIQRIDIVWLVVAIAAGLIGASILLWGTCEGISQIIKIKDYTPLVYPLALFSLIIGATTFTNDRIIKEYITHFFPIFSLIMTLVEILLLVIALIRKKGIKNTENSNQKINW